jgi:chromosomal replication initiation ATPase DnaA
MTPTAQARVTALVGRLDEVLAENARLKREIQEHELLAVPVPSIGRLIAAAAAEFGVTYRAILGHVRVAEIVVARQVVMYLAATRLHRSLPLIGRCLNRDHSTVLHGRERIAVLVARDPDFAARVERVATAAIQRREFAA